MARIEFEVILNGTDTNPFHKMGLTQNPFPPISDAKYISAGARLNKLAADPIKSTEQIRETLQDYMTEEFIDFCCSQFVPGKMVKFKVAFEE